MRKNTRFLFLIIGCLFFAAFSSFYSASWNRISLYVVLPISFVLCFIENGASPRTNKYVHLLWALFAWVMVTVLYATRSDYALRELRQIMGVFLVSFVFGVVAKKKGNVPWLYLVYFVLYLSVWNYARNNILGEITFGEDRLNDDKLNANMLAYYTFFISFASFILGEIIKKNWLKKTCMVLFFLSIPLSFLVAIYTASRQVFVIQIPLISVLLYYRYFRSTKGIYRLLFIISVIAISAYAIPKAQVIYENSFLRFRNEQTSIEGVRGQLLIDSFNVGMRHFFTGVGAGNYAYYSFDGHFSHNTFLELFANTGIVGMMLFIVLLASYLKTQFRRLRTTGDHMYFYFFWFGIVYALACMFYVYYPKMWLMGFFILVASHSETYYKNSIIQRQAGLIS